MKKASASTCLFLLFILCLHSVTTGTQKLNSPAHASLPPRGWNSYDSFCWTISEEEFLDNAKLVAQRLHPHGYEHVVVDYLWYRRLVPGAYVDSLGFDVIDEWGRMIPDPGRWPSSRGGKGFTEVAEKVHTMGLKFGIHVMRGISTQAFNANTPILDIATGRPYEESGRKWYAKDIGIKERACAWMQNGFMSVNTSLGAGRAFLRSLYTQYADWGVDFVKHDCVFGEDLSIDEISFVSEVLRELERPILYSLSPGTSVTPTMAKAVNGLVNMYRITADDWDSWGDVAAHFDVTRDFSAANLIGSKGLMGRSWPDLDMLPLGWVTDPGVNQGPHRNCRLSLDEQRTQMTLWSMAKSPLMFGGDVRKLDDTTFSLITNPTLLEINSFSSNNMEFPYVNGSKSLQSRDHGLTFHLRSLKNVAGSEILVSLTSCNNVEARGWTDKAVDDDLDLVCWKENSSKQESPFCLFKGTLALTLGEEMTYKQEYHGKFHLLATGTSAYCFGASPNRKLTSKELQRLSFLQCRRHTNQLNNNGTLTNSYSGLCASVKTVKANAGSGGVRSWIATGRTGEIYVALFNLNSERTLISTTIEDLAKALPGRNLSGASCKGREVWSGQDYGVIKQVISIAVEAHGCALFVLTCN